MDGFLCSVIDPGSNMIGPGVMREDGVSAALIGAGLLPAGARGELGCGCCCCGCDEPYGGAVKPWVRPMPPPPRRLPFA